MKVFVCAAVIVLSFFALDYVGSQLDVCNFSRLDVSTCRFSMPDPNDYRIFFTRLVSGQSGQLDCRIRNRRTVTEEIINLGQQQLRIMFSPGFQLDPQQEYGDQQLVVFYVECGDGELAYFQLTDLDLEERNCPVVGRDEDRCQDYVNVTDGSSGMVENCGTNTTINNERLLDGSFTVLFRTSHVTRSSGFRGYAVCFQPEETDVEGCTRAEGDSEMNSTESRRRKRDLEDFHNQWRKKMHRMRRQGMEFRFERLQILIGDTVRYREECLVITRSTDTDEPLIFKDIIFLHTFDLNGTVAGFFKEARFEFRGPGPLVILGQYAFFQLFAIDPRGVIPTEAEAMLIGNLTNAQFELVTPDDDIVLPTDLLNPPTPNFEDLLGIDPGGKRRKRQTTTDPFSDEIVIIAIQNENACNPVLRAQSIGVLSLVDDVREQMLRDQLAATTSPPTTAMPTEEPGGTTPSEETTPFEETTSSGMGDP